MKQPTKLIKIVDVPLVVYELTGVKRTRTCIYEWIRIGRIGSDGERIKLKTIKQLGFLYTTHKWITEFVEKL